MLTGIFLSDANLSHRELSPSPFMVLCFGRYSELELLWRKTIDLSSSNHAPIKGDFEEDLTSLLSLMGVLNKCFLLTSRLVRRLKNVHFYYCQEKKSPYKEFGMLRREYGKELMVER